MIRRVALATATTLPAFAGCSHVPACAPVAASTVSMTGFPAASARWSSAVPAGPAWAFGVPAETVSIDPEVAVFATDADPSRSEPARVLVPMDRIAIDSAGPLDSDRASPELLALVGDQDAIEQVHACVLDRLHPQGGP